MARVRTGTGKKGKDGAKRAAVELCRAEVPLSTIRSHSSNCLSRPWEGSWPLPRGTPSIPSSPGVFLPLEPACPVGCRSSSIVRMQCLNTSADMYTTYKNQNINFLNLFCNFFFTFMHDWSGFSAHTVLQWAHIYSNKSFIVLQDLTSFKLYHQEL